MTALQNKDTNHAETPLDRLAAYHHDDMLAVNQLILKHMQSDVPLIPKLAGYLIAAGGKRLRPLLTLASARLCEDGSERPYGLAAAVEFIHTATLLHDDVVDESLERRGQQSANEIFGNTASVLVGDFLFSRAFQLMVADGSLDVLRILSQASATIAEGEVLQLTTTNNLDAGIDDYIHVITGKTAALFAAACEVGPVIAGSDQKTQNAMREFGLNLGIAFQIADDILDYSAEHEALGKTIGDDFREGKMTLPVILALQDANAEERYFWKRVLSEHDQHDGDLELAQSILARHNAGKQATDIARKYAVRAKSNLAAFKDTPLKSLLLEIIDYTIDRTS